MKEVQAQDASTHSTLKKGGNGGGGRNGRRSARPGMPGIVVICRDVPARPHRRDPQRRLGALRLMRLV